MQLLTFPAVSASLNTLNDPAAGADNMGTFIMLAVLFVVLAVGSAVMMAIVMRRRTGKGKKRETPAAAQADTIPNALSGDAVRHATEITNLAARLMQTDLNEEQRNIAISLIGEAHALLRPEGRTTLTRVIEEEAGGEAPDLGGYGILVAVSNPVIRDRIKELLNAANAKVETAESGQEAYKIFSNYPVQYRLVLLGTDLEGMDGPDTAWKMRSIKTAYVRSVPIIGITDGSEGQKVACIGAGMNEVLTEAFSKKELYGLLTKHIRRG